MWKRLIGTLLVLCIASTPAFAHVGVGSVNTFRAGFWHPLTGIDHVLAMVAVGLYAASLGGRALWLVPSAFVATMIFGGILGYTGFPLPLVEEGIGLSVVVMGLAIASGTKLPTVIAMTLVGLFALFHGHAHGSEGAGLGFSFIPYAVGFIIATASLHVLGISFGMGLDELASRTSGVLRRTAGALGAIAGVCILAGWLAT
jgi:urease accessory protein